MSIEFKIVDDPDDGSIQTYPDTPNLIHVDRDYYECEFEKMKSILDCIVGKNSGYTGGDFLIRSTQEWKLHLTHSGGELRKAWIETLIKATPYANMLVENGDDL